MDEQRAFAPPYPSYASSMGEQLHAFSPPHPFASMGGEQQRSFAPSNPSFNSAGQQAQQQRTLAGVGAGAGMEKFAPTVGVNGWRCHLTYRTGGALRSIFSARNVAG